MKKNLSNLSTEVRNQILKRLPLDKLPLLDKYDIKDNMSFWMYHCQPYEFPKIYSASEFRNTVLKNYEEKNKWHNLNFKHKIYNISHNRVTQIRLFEDSIITSSDDGTICLVNTDTGDFLTFEGHTSGVWCFDMINNILVSGSVDKHVIFWDLRNAWVKKKFYAHENTVRCLEISRNRAVTGGRDGVIKIWSLSKLEMLYKIEKHEASVRCLKIHKNLIVSGDYAGNICVTRLSNGSLHNYTFIDNSRIYAVDVGEEFIICSTQSGQVAILRIFDENCKKIKLKENKIKPVVFKLTNSLIGWVFFLKKFDPEKQKLFEKYIICGSVKGQIFITDLNGKIVKTFNLRGSIVKLLMRNYILLVCLKDSVKIYCLKEFKFMNNLIEKGNIINASFVENKIAVVCKISESETVVREFRV